MTRRILTARDQVALLAPWRIAMPAIDAYDDDIPQESRWDHGPPDPGPWFHGTDQELSPGTIIRSLRDAKNVIPADQHDRMMQRYRDWGQENQANWVWVANSPDYAAGYGKHVYHVEPMDEGPWEWNGDGSDSGNRFVSPRARVVKEMLPDEHGRHLDYDGVQKLMGAS